MKWYQTTLDFSLALFPRCELDDFFEFEVLFGNDLDEHFDVGLGQGRLSLDNDLDGFDDDILYAMTKKR